MMESFTRRSWASIDLDAIRHNYHTIRNSLAPSTKLMAVIKANGYGHNACVLAQEYAKLGAEWIAVSNIDEGMELRNHGCVLPILILGYTPPELVGMLVEQDITQTVYSLPYAHALSAQLKQLGLRLKAHLKIDTGMTRLGLYYRDAQEDGGAVVEAVEICRMPEFEFEGIYTHFAAADEGEKGESFTRRQFSLFREIIQRLEEEGITFRLRHCCNSAATIAYPEMQLDMVRPGIILYGIAPSRMLEGKMDLLPVMQVNSIVSRVRQVEAGVDVSYGRTYTTSKPSRIATVPIGYADGYSRLLTPKAEMLVNGQRAKIVGRICMDQLMLDVTDIEGVQEGTLVVCFGGTHPNSISVNELADIMGTISYELVCNMSRRVPAVFTEQGKPVGYCALDYTFQPLQ